MAELSKTQSVLPVQKMDSHAAVFNDREAHVGLVELPADIFEELGRPAFITVTVEPGDKLNDETEAASPFTNDRLVRLCQARAVVQDKQIGMELDAAIVKEALDG